MTITAATILSLKNIPSQSGSRLKSWEWPHAAVSFNAHPFGIKAWDCVELNIMNQGQGFFFFLLYTQEHVYIIAGLTPQSVGIQSPSPGHYSFGVLPFDQLIRTYFWMMLSTPKLQVTSVEARTKLSKYWAQSSSKKTYLWPGLIAWLAACSELSLLHSLGADHLVLNGKTDSEEGFCCKFQPEQLLGIASENEFTASRLHLHRRCLWQSVGNVAN